MLLSSQYRCICRNSAAFTARPVSSLSPNTWPPRAIPDIIKPANVQGCYSKQTDKHDAGLTSELSHWRICSLILGVSTLPWKEKERESSAMWTLQHQALPVIALEFFKLVWHLKVVKVVHQNRSDNHCNWSDARPSILSTTRALLATPCFLPCLEHTQTHTLSLPLCAFFCFLFCFWALVKQNNSWYWPVTDFPPIYMLILTSKILRITNSCEACNAITDTHPKFSVWLVGVDGFIIIVSAHLSLSSSIVECWQQDNACKG